MNLKRRHLLLSVLASACHSGGANEPEPKAVAVQTVAENAPTPGAARRPDSVDPKADSVDSKADSVDSKADGVDPRALHTCRISLSKGTEECDVPFEVELGESSGRVVVNMPAGHSLRVTAEVCDPREWVLNIGDSQSNDGGGGDAGHSSNDAEIHIHNTALTVVGNDHALGEQDRTRTHEGFVAASGCTDVMFVLGDGSVKARGADLHQHRADTLLRIAPEGDDEGASDSVWFIGLNRVVAGTYRRGSGLDEVVLTITED